MRTAGLTDQVALHYSIIYINIDSSIKYSVQSKAFFFLFSADDWWYMVQSLGGPSRENEHFGSSGLIFCFHKINACEMNENMLHYGLTN